MRHTVAYYIDSKEFGGTEQVVYTVLKHMDRKKWKPVLIYHPFSGISEFIDNLRELDVDIVCVPEIKSWIDIGGIMKFISALRQIKPSVFHANQAWNIRCSYGITCAFLSRLPVLISTQHGYYASRSRKILLTQKLISLLLDRYIAVSQGITGLSQFIGIIGVRY